MKINELNEHISLTTDLWNNEVSTNCYAFALGLDIPEKEITKDAYQVGILGCKVFNLDNRVINLLSYNDRLKLDLKALKISLKEIDPKDAVLIKEEDESGSLISWPIALFEDGIDFHFMRKSNDGIWYHKQGYESSITGKDSLGEEITNPKKCHLGKYKYKKTYQLTFNERC